MKFRKKPVVIDALQWTGANYVDMEGFLRSPRNGYFMGDGTLRIATVEGVMRASPGDWIICGVAGEFYPCKPDIFEKTYEPVEPPVTEVMHHPV